MRYLLLSDIHGNLPALEAVLKDAHPRGFDRVLFLGDAVGYYPDGEEVLNRLRELRAEPVMGNHDLWLLEPETFFGRGFIKALLEWQREALSEENLAYMRTWPLERLAPLYHQVHGSPCEPFIYIDELEPAREAFACSDRPLILVGHTHIAGVYEALEGPSGPWIRFHPFNKRENTYRLPEGARAIINPGSVGQPRDGVPLAAYAIWDEDEGAVHAYRVPFDLAAVKRRVVEVGFPLFLYERLLVGR